MPPTCDVCNDTREITVATDLVQDGEGGWRWLCRPMPCPECTEDGRAIIAADLAADDLLGDIPAERSIYGRAPSLPLH